MKKIVSLFMSVALLLSLLAGCSKTEQYTVELDVKAGDISVVSYNVAAPWGNLKQGTSAQRVKRFAAYMNAVSPDTIGTQEMNQYWMDKLEELMPAYDSYGIPRGGDENEKKSEMNSIFWRKDKFRCVDCGTFWLSETIYDESKYEGAGCNRICSYVVLEDKNTKKQFIHLNTHLDNASEDAREFGAQTIMDTIELITDRHPQAKIVLTGDFNDVEGSKPYNIVSAQFKDCAKSNEANAGPTYTDWGNKESIIDFVFTDAEPVDYLVLDMNKDGFVSDHNGVFAMINL
ncbi:MAG: endonuclease/exonuclease/phosphatase family protein [Eubacteriales bacterium]|nr:endonuclease/exonuclease/phosphatase family protein [Eubacteriales bacterium]